jgi:kinetochore protein Spc7/SPC105
MSLSYHREIELVFDAASFQTSNHRSQGSNARIDLWYIGANREKEPSPLTAEKEFMLNCIRDNMRALPQAQTKVSAFLRAVATSWDKTRTLARQVKLVQTTFRAETLRTSDRSVALRVPMLLAQLESKVELVISLTCTQTGSEGDIVQIGITPRAAVVYGETFNAPKMGEFLAARIGSTLKADQAELDGGSWVDALLDLQTKLLARGKKATI